MIKSKRKVFLICLFFIFVTSIVVVLFIKHLHTPPLSYVYKKSNFNDFQIDQENVVLDNYIVVKNNTGQDLNFYMLADVKEDLGLVTEDTAVAYNLTSMKKEIFHIDAHSQSIFRAYFVASKGNSGTKANRRPPKNIIFEIVNQQ